MSCNSVAVAPSMRSSVLVRRSTGVTGRFRRGKPIICSQSPANPAQNAASFSNRPQRVSWSSEFWNRQNVDNRRNSYDSSSNHDEQSNGYGYDSYGVEFKEEQRRGYSTSSAAGFSDSGQKYNRYARSFERFSRPLQPEDPNRRPRSRFQEWEPADGRFSRKQKEIGTATKILSAIRNDMGASSQVIDRQTPPSNQVDVTPVVTKVPAHPTTIYGHRMSKHKVETRQRNRLREVERAKQEASINENTYLGNEEWRRKRIHWICTEIPRLDARQTVQILNSQIKWLRNKDISIICYRLLNIDHYNRAHRVYKWSEQRPWFVLDFELTSKMCEVLSDTGRIGRARDLFDIIIKNTYIPRESTYTALIKAYLQDGNSKYIDEAWKIYTRMIEFGNYEPPPVVKNSLFKYLTESGPSSLRWIDRATQVFNRIRETNLPCTTEMYESLIVLNALKGEEEEVQNLVNDMNSRNVELSPLIFGAIIRVCSKTGNYLRAEQVFQQLKDTNEELDWHYYIALIQAYGKASLHEKALNLFSEVENSEHFPKLMLFKAIIVVMADANKVEETEKLLDKVHPSLPKFQTLQSAFNAVMSMYIRLGMFEKVDTTFEYMRKAGCRPNIESHNLELEGFVKRGMLQKAEQLYHKMINRECLRPNYQSHAIMLGAYGKAKMNSKVKEVFKLLTEHKQPVPEEFQTYVEKSVSPTWLEKAKRYVKPLLTATQRSIISGVLLAGAKMTKESFNSASLHFEQDAGSYKGQVLMKNLYEVFEDWAVERPKVVFEGMDEEMTMGNSSEEQNMPVERAKVGDADKLHFRTSPNVKFWFYYYQYRPEGKLKVPRLVHRWLSDLTIAYWYMYGGYKSTDGQSIILNAAPYNYNELCLVVEAMHERKMQCTIMRDGQDQCYLKFSDESAVWLWRLIKEYILPELVDLLKPDDVVKHSPLAELQPCPTWPSSRGETDLENKVLGTIRTFTL